MRLHFQYPYKDGGGPFSRSGVEKILASKDLKMGRFVVKEMLPIIFNIQLLWGMGPERPAVHNFQSLT